MPTYWNEIRFLFWKYLDANIIGKAGATIKKLRSKTRANIKITAKDASDPTHSCAMDFDNFLLVSTWDFNFLLIY